MSIVQERGFEKADSTVPNESLLSEMVYIPSVDGETSLQRSKIRVLDRKSRVWTDSSGAAPRCSTGSF